MKDAVESPEISLLFQAVRLDDKETALWEAEQILKEGEINWDDFYVRADLHCIIPQAGILLNKLPSKLIPQEIIDRFKEANLQNTSQQLYNIAEFLKVKKILDEAGIPAIPFKGFWLAHSLYGNLSERESVDVDLFIRLEDLDKVIPLMPQLGYRAETSSSANFLNLIKKTSAEYNFDKFEGSHRICHVEFHWKLGSAMHGLDVSLDDMQNQIIQGRLQNREFQVFSHSANFLLAVMHHGGKDPMVQLKHISDFGYFLLPGKYIDWSWVMIQAQRFDVESLVLLAVNLASRLTGIEIPAELKERSNSSKIQRLANERIQMMKLKPELWYNTAFDKKNLIFHVKTRNNLKINLRMLSSSLYSRVVKLLVSDRLMGYYLKKRYNISH